MILVDYKIGDMGEYQAYIDKDTFDDWYHEIKRTTMVGTFKVIGIIEVPHNNHPAPIVGRHGYPVNATVDTQAIKKAMKQALDDDKLWVEPSPSGFHPEY